MHRFLLLSLSCRSSPLDNVTPPSPHHYAAATEALRWILSHTQPPYACLSFLLNSDFALSHAEILIWVKNPSSTLVKASETLGSPHPA